MQRTLLVPLCCLVSLSAAQLAAQTSGPETRVPTDARAVTSGKNALAHAIPFDALYVTRRVSDAAWSPDGTQVAFTTDLAGRMNLWKVAAAGGWPVQLTQSNEQQLQPVWSPDGKWLAFQQDQGGNELWDVFAVSSDGAQLINLTDTPEVREEAPRWSPDGKTIALNVKGRTAPSYDLALLDFATRKVSSLTHERSPERSWSSVAWSPDGRTLYANRMEVSFTDSDVYAVDVATGRTRDLTPHKGKVLYLATSLSPDGKTLLVTSNEKGGFSNVMLLEVASGQRTSVTDTRWEATSGDFSPRGDSFTYTLNADGVVDAYVVDRATLHATPVALGSGVTALPANPSSYAPGGDRLLLSYQSSVRPADLWIYDLRAGSPRRLTYSAVASLGSAPMPDSQIVHYKSFDGKMISALLWVPFNLERNGANPALVLPHGGPTGQRQDLWSPAVAALVSRGYICIAPNVRGSTGYGIEFQKANYQDLGGGDLQDEVYAVRFLEATGYVDPHRIGITGGSYGGFMTLMALGRTPTVWAAGVELFGIINWKTMLKHSDALLQQYEQSLLGDPVKDEKVYESTSPLAYIHDVRAPLLVLQGDNDPRVPKEEAVQVVELLKKDGKTVEAHYYPDEGHGFMKRENRIDSTARTVEWFDRYLKVPAAAKPASN
jgi:dipeptidyl aminopeptidase/acylaminoacyl peptidase